MRLSKQGEGCVLLMLEDEETVCEEGVRVRA
jgi:hypothetical protein